MHWVAPEHEGHMPPGLACIDCRYDLGGLAWGTRCPECGFPAPAAWPTSALGEAHPAFIAHLHDRFRDLWHVDACLAFGLLLLALVVLLEALLPTSPASGVLALVGAVCLVASSVYGCIALARLSTSHRNARMDLDLPHRKAILWSFVFTVAPLGMLVLSVFFAFIMLAGTWCIVVPAMLTSAIAAICLLVNTADHASTTIERTGNSPRWTRAELAAAVATACWPIAILMLWAYLGGAGVAISVLLLVAMLCVTHALRMRHAQEVVRLTLRQRRQQLARFTATSEDPPLASPRS
ncbi:MAG: hypothetical protein RIE32_08080 [Phycisphaerales bacterium]